MNIVDMIKCLFRPVTKAYPVTPEYREDQDTTKKDKEEAHKRLTEAEVRLEHLKLLAQVIGRKGEEPH